MGKSQSGKTTVAVKIIQYLLPTIDDVVVCSPTYGLQPTWEPVSRYIKHSYNTLDYFLENIFKIIAVNEYSRKVLIVLDDVSFDKKLNEGSKGTISQLAYNAVWYNISIMVICHKASNISAGFRENIEYLILFQTIDNDELDKLAAHFSITGRKKDLIELYKEIVAKPAMNGQTHTFLFISFRDGIKLYQNFTSSIKLD